MPTLVGVLSPIMQRAFHARFDNPAFRAAAAADAVADAAFARLPLGAGNMRVLPPSVPLFRARVVDFLARLPPHHSTRDAGDRGAPAAAAAPSRYHARGAAAARPRALHSQSLPASASEMRAIATATLLAARGAWVLMSRFGEITRGLLRRRGLLPPPGAAGISSALPAGVQRAYHVAWVNNALRLPLAGQADTELAHLPRERGLPLLPASAPVCNLSGPVFLRDAEARLDELAPRSSPDDELAHAPSSGDGGGGGDEDDDGGEGEGDEAYREGDSGDESEHASACRACGAEGHVLCCDTCSNVFHQQCARPPLPHPARCPHRRHCPPCSPRHPRRSGAPPRRCSH
jgi:hypothetical protein